MHQFGLCSRYKTCCLAILLPFFLWFFLLCILFLCIILFCRAAVICGIFLLLVLTCILLCSARAATLSSALRTSAPAPSVAPSTGNSRSFGRNRSVRTGYLLCIFRGREPLSVFIHGNAVFCPASGAVHRIPVRCCSTCKKFTTFCIIFRNKIIAIAVNPLPSAKESSRELPRFRT